MSKLTRVLPALLLVPLLLALVGPAGALPRWCAVAGELVRPKVEFFYDGAWNDHTSKVYDRDPIQIRRGISNEVGRVDPGEARFTINNRDGEFSPRNPRSSLFGKIGRNTPVRISAGLEGGTQSIRFVGEVVQFPSRWDLSGNDVYVPVEAAGILRRLGTPSRPLRSALYRATVRESTVVGYWPLEGLPREGTQVVPAAIGPSGTIRSTGSAIIAPMKWSVENELAGSTALPTLDTERGVAGVEADITTSGDPALGIWYWTRTGVPPKSGANDIFTQATLTLFLTDEAVPRYHLTTLTFPAGSTSGTEETLTVRGGTADNVGASIDTVEAAGEPFADQWRMVYARFSQSGSDISVSVVLDDEEVASGSFAGTLDQVVGMRMGLFTDGSASDQVDPISVGHPTIAVGTTSELDASASAAYTAGRGHTGETAGRRVERLCDEESVTFTSTGDLDETIAMGVQGRKTFLGLLDEAADAEAAGSRVPILVEQREANGLHFNTRRSFHIVQ